MTIEEKIRCLEAHLEAQPHDYRAVIELLKARSEEIEYSARRRQEKKLAEIQKYKEALDGEHSQQ